MKRKELIEAISESTSIPKYNVTQVITSMQELITEELKGGGSVMFTGFCTFDTSKRKARKGRNPSTGEEIDIAASTVVNIKAGATLKKEVKNA